MQKKIISIIIPIYNSENYIEMCIESILSQTYVNLEIICVDDGSTDRSVKLCEKYANIDKRIKIINKKNGGVSSARNCGLNYATGDFISFVDSDDTIEKTMYEKMIKNMSDEVDMVCCGINRLKNDGSFNEYVNIYNKNKLLTPEEAMKACLENTYTGFNVYTKLFKKELFDGVQKIRFPEGKLMEEANILPKIFKKCKKIMYIGDALYNYYERENSYTTKVLNEECYYIYETIKNYEENLYKDYPNIKNELMKWKILNCLFLYRRALLEKEKMNYKVFERIQLEFDKIFWFGIVKCSLKYKIMLIETKSRIFLLRKRKEIKK